MNTIVHLTCVAMLVVILVTLQSCVSACFARVLAVDNRMMKWIIDTKFLTNCNNIAGL